MNFQVNAYIGYTLRFDGHDYRVIANYLTSLYIQPPRVGGATSATLFPPKHMQTHSAHSDFVTIPLMDNGSYRGPTPIEYLRLPDRAYQALLRNNIATIEDLERYLPDDLLTLKRVGKMCEEQILAAYKSYLH